ncbi:TonB-dependent receptor [Luteimonas sp. M1R5S18]|uniref:TonB-dependent receptor n=1 Tax=Luteimonas rhizosphaericola TaxID=3042024 RepID=A0ABT6JKU4_9GAMM|nr:TonB-dependent receptor [Luteimonas rhizosphaericola]MDH5831058.1 TonB-dependent receptor [Luteimonas rhizosphaericola]
MKYTHAAPKRRLLTSALLIALAPPLAAQTAAQDPVPSTSAEQATNDDPAELDTIVVTGIRASLESSMNIKRDAQGVVDGIVAEDIGKFPDTNLAESLQRISGVSIDRTSSGEGQKITVRGLGPDYNLVLLNGRQMPASNLGPGGAGASSARSFDFSNLASESISAVNVYKTGRADNPTGGIGATIDVRTARPLEADPVVSLGLKSVYDESNQRLPRTLKGSDFTGELSGIFSQSYADGRFGVMLSGSYQERDSGFNQASVADGWLTFAGDNADPGCWQCLPQEGQGYSDRIENRPGPGDIYARPQNTGYSVNGIQRQRTNGQVTLQWAPTDNVTATVDYNYIEQQVQVQRSELSVWFNQGAGDSSWTDGPIAAPIMYSEDMVGSDLSMGGARIGSETTSDMLGFNVEWEVNDALSLEFDYHDSSATSRPSGPYGSAGVLGVAAYIRGNTTVDYSGEIPIVNVLLPAGVSQVDPSQALVTGSVFQNSYNKSEVEQLQAKGRFEFGDYSGLDFGISTMEVNNRSASAVMQRDTWGGVGTPADYDDDIWYNDSMARYFEAFGNHDNPMWTDDFLVFDFERLRQAAIGITGCPSCYEMPTEFTDDIRTREKSESAYVQWTSTFGDVMPLHVALGVRYEKTDVESEGLQRVGQTITWIAANELAVDYAPEREFTRDTGSYDFVLPNLDLKLDITEEMVLRGSYSQTIGRPGWGDISAGQVLQPVVRASGGEGRRGDPSLEPLKSDNFDLSFEWYYGEGNYFSVGYFRKDIENFISTTIVREEPFQLNTPVGGAYWNAALAAGCSATDGVCIRTYIFENFAGQPGVVQTGFDSEGNPTGGITGQPGDPVAGFNISVPANQRSDEVDGWEINVQHMFGQTGFGVAANYTMVDSGLTFDDQSLGQQYPLVGLSDSANLVAFYDRNDWQVRLAYNWRDEFYAGSGPRTDPNHVEAYGQLDANVSWQVSENLTLSLEGINLTDETMRTHARHENMVRFATQTGPRYMFGVRYKF